MNESQLKAVKETYKDSSLRLDQYLFSKIGLIKEETILKLESYYLNCVPFTLSLHSARFLSALSPREVEHFKQYQGQKHNLHLVFQSPLLSEKVRLYIKSKVKTFELMEGGGMYCLIELEFPTVPRDYALILTDMFKRLEIFQKLYDHETVGLNPLVPTDFKPLGLEDHVALRTRSDEKIRCKILEISLRNVKLFVDVDEDELSNRDSVALEFRRWNQSFFINAKPSSHEESSEVPGTFVAEFDLQHSPSLSDILSPFLVKGMESSSQEDPDAEPEAEEPNEKDPAAK